MTPSRWSSAIQMPSAIQSHACLRIIRVMPLWPLRQDHYDYGLRNLKAVLNMAGALKRADPNMNEEAILMRALRSADVISVSNSISTLDIVAKCLEAASSSLE
jgi:hypothetical protein